VKYRFNFSLHYRLDKDIDASLAIDCILAGKRQVDKAPHKYKSSKKFRKGELVVVWKRRGEECFVITAYWKT